MQPNRELDQSIARQSDRWVETLQTSGPQEHAAFAAWLRQSVREANLPSGAN